MINKPEVHDRYILQSSEFSIKFQWQNYGIIWGWIELVGHWIVHFPLLHNRILLTSEKKLILAIYKNHQYESILCSYNYLFTNPLVIFSYLRSMYKYCYQLFEELYKYKYWNNLHEQAWTNIPCDTGINNMFTYVSVLKKSKNFLSPFTLKKVKGSDWNG